MSVYSYLAKEINNNTNVINNVIDIGEVKSLNPMSIFLSDIILDSDDIILTDKIQKLVEPFIPEIEGDCTINQDKYEQNKLKIGDKVVLYGVEDGQKYIVFDKVVI